MIFIVKAYLIGFIFALGLSVHCMKDDEGHLSIGEFFICTLIALLSWITVVGMWVGLNIKHGHDKEVR